MPLALVATNYRYYSDVIKASNGFFGCIKNFEKKYYKNKEK